MAKEKVMYRYHGVDNPLVKESIRFLRNKLVLDDEHHKVFCFSSLYPKEGVSTIVQMLAVCLGDIKKNVIVVSADLKHKNDDFSTVPFTLKDYLMRECDFESIVQNVNGYFKIIVGSNSNEDHSDLLYKDMFADLIERMKVEYDFVLIDSPSFSVASEAIILSKLADSLLMVVKENSVEIDAFSDFSVKLKRQNISIRGVILNQVRETENLEIKSI